MTPETSPSLFQSGVAFTGRLASMTREEAFALVRDKGGAPRRGVTKKTSILVVGELGWPLLRDGRPSKSLSMAHSYGIAVASERRFLEWAGRTVPDAQAKTYSAAQISSLSGLPLEVVERVTDFGLLDRRDDHYGFRDLSAARQLSDLFDAGIAVSTIIKSLHEIRKWLPGVALANLRLHADSSDGVLVEYMKARTDKRGQFVLPVGDARGDDPDDLFEQAQAAEEAKDFDAAQRLYRKIMYIDPRDPAAAFNLGNLLRGAGRKVEAEAAYRAASKADPTFAEAWYNLADMLDERGETDQAVACLNKALKADPGYADALFNLGLLHQRHDRLSEAAACWRRYLDLDRESAWAARAKQALKYCEIKLAQSR